MNSSLPDIWQTSDNNSLLNKTSKENQHQKMSDTENNTIVANVTLAIALIGIIENSISFLALRKSKELRNPTTVFILNLCVADLVYCLMMAVNNFNLEVNQNYYICILSTMMKYFVGLQSVNLIVAITINRYICVVYPKVYRSVYSPKYLGLQIAFIWMYSLSLALLPAFEVFGWYGYHPELKICVILGPKAQMANNFFAAVACGLPMLAIIICYPRIFWVTYKATKRARKSNMLHNPATLNATLEGDDPRGESVRNRLDEKELKVLRVMLAIVVAFIICYLPSVMIKLSGKESTMPTFSLITYLAILLSNIINPIIYIAMSAEFRKAYLELFLCKKIWIVWSTASTVK